MSTEFNSRCISLKSRRTRTCPFMHMCPLHFVPALQDHPCLPFLLVDLFVLEHPGIKYQMPEVKNVPVKSGTIYKWGMDSPSVPVLLVYRVSRPPPESTRYSRKHLYTHNLTSLYKSVLCTSMRHMSRNAATHRRLQKLNVSTKSTIKRSRQH